jgi:DNA-directed RNA polymerase subunit alpha
MRGLDLHRPIAVVPDTEKGTATYGIFTAQPFERGWGVTIGNALRRILLSSIEGAAIVAARFVGVSHEYDSIPGVMEDVTDLILNLKRVALKLSGVESVTATMKGSGPGLLTTGSIQGGADLEIVDPNVHLATLSEEGTLEAELVVRRGRGFVPADEQDKRDLGVGFIFLDAAYSPVRKANFRIEPARVGQATDYEKLVIELWTNGVITPAAAIAEAARLLADHLPIFVQLEAAPAPVVVEPADQMLEAGIETLEVSGRILNMLQNAGITKLRQLVAYSEDELIKVPGFGKKALAEVKEKIETLGLSLGMRFDLPQSS